jgi:hypothetical protein
MGFEHNQPILSMLSEVAATGEPPTIKLTYPTVH